jgi:serine/threonine protein kinase
MELNELALSIPPMTFRLEGYSNIKVLYQGRNTVYSATEAASGDAVCLKRATDPNSRIREEAAALQMVTHHSIIKPITHIDVGGSTVIVLPFADGGSLAESLQTHVYDEPALTPILRSIAAAAKHLHRRVRMIHGDVKPDNILIIGGRAVLADFEDATPFEPGQTFQGRMGTLAFMSPEMVRGDPFDEKTDIWSLGITAFLSLARSWPFLDQEDPEEEIKRGLDESAFDVLSEVSEEAWDCINGMLDSDPSQRLTAKQVWEHEWLEARD